MEFCPEIAVFHSAFQLVSKQTKNHLSQLSKHSSRQYMDIIKTAVDEICSGLEQDNTEEEAAAWNQKLHLICLYSVVESNYRESVEKKEGRVPVVSSLDMIAGMLPKFSPQFYFEILKTCSWTHLLVECLDYIDRSTATTLLFDLLEHSQYAPVVPDDTEVFSMVTEKILSSCFNLTVTMDTSISGLLKPLSLQKKFVQIVYPDNEESALKNEKLSLMKCYDEDSSSEEKIGTSFWDHFMDKHPDVMFSVLDYLEKCLGLDFKNDINCVESTGNMMTEVIPKIFLFWYIHLSGSPEIKNTDPWFVNNLYASKNLGVRNESSFRRGDDPRYSLNKSLIIKLGKKEIRERLIEMVKYSIEKYVNIDVRKEKTLFENDICVLRTKEDCVFVRKPVILRMVQSSLLDLTEGGEKYSLTDHLPCVERQHCLIVEEDWSKDISADALLWRIDNGLPLHDECLETLLSERCWCFWKYDRVQEVMKGSASMLCKQSHFLKLIKILTYLLQQDCDTIVQRMREVLCVTFDSMSTQDKDAIVGLVYADDTIDMRSLLGNVESPSLHLQITNIFNKVTADLDDQVLNDVLLCCLIDPVTVYKSVLEMCVKNQDQAFNFAQLLCCMPQSCKSKHPIDHPDRSLLGSMIDGFTRDAKLTEKEEKHFNVFVGTLMERTIKEHSTLVLSPTEFINTSLLEAINVHNFASSDYPIKSSFALSLLITVFGCGGNVNCDWSECEFEPVVLIANLAGILHECTELWDDEVHATSKTLNDKWNSDDTATSSDMDKRSGEKGVSGNCKDSSVTIIPGYQKIAMREKGLVCLELVQSMMVDGVLGTPDDETVGWLLDVTDDFNCIVKLTLAKFLLKVGHIQPMTGWVLMFHELTRNLKENLPLVLLMSITDTRFIDEMDEIDVVPEITYDDLIIALVQIMPNLLTDGLQEVWKVIELFLDKGSLSVCYRSTSNCALPLTDLSSVQSVLCISQILRDAILTLNVIQGSRLSILQHVLQCYVTVIKVQCEDDFASEELHLFTLSQIFHHVCVLVKSLSPDCVDNGLVLLLHLLIKFKDIAMEITSNVKVKSTSKDVSQGKGRSCRKFNAKLMKNFENEMLFSVEGLSDSFEEKHMLIKKLSGPVC